MNPDVLLKAAILMSLIVVVSIGSWEIFLRNRGLEISYDDGPPLWSNNRAMVYEPADKATVFIGSSRIKFDLDIDTWQRLTGKHAIQLAVAGSSPLPVLKDLADDERFKGKLVVDVTEPLFFSPSRVNSMQPEANIHYYRGRTPAQQASFLLDHVLESQLVFLDKDFLSLNAGLDKLKIPNRPGIQGYPLFPIEFKTVGFDRQSKMTSRFLADTTLQGRVSNIWRFMMLQAKRGPRPAADFLPAVLQSIKDATDKIKARGGEVVFLRTPCSGWFRAAEDKGFPRADYWDRLLTFTQCRGYHFADHPATDHFICPESSHLSPQDAVLFTKEIVKLLPPSFVQNRGSSH